MQKKCQKKNNYKAYYKDTKKEFLKSGTCIKIINK